MKVRLISYSQPAQELFTNDVNNAQELIAFCARVSNPSNQYNKETSEKLISYLCNNKHWSPLEMVNVCLEIETTRDIGRQILRHRSFSFQEFSQRYADPTKDFEFVLREARLQDDKNRQNSIPLDSDMEHHRELQMKWEDIQQEVIAKCLSAYKWARENNIAKEQCRVVLPEGLTPSRMYMNGTLRSWAHYIDLRSSNGTQQEHMDIAKCCAEVITNIFPMIKKFVKED